MSVKQIDGYKIYMGQVLGTGSYGSVYVGKSDKNGDKVAIKVLEKRNIDSDDYLKAALFSEIKIMQTLKSPNIVGFYDVMQSSKNYYIIQQLCEGDITKQIMRPGKQLAQKDSIDMLTQICNGFLTLIMQGIIHRDLKPANIMIKNKVLKIGDFGFAKKTPNQKFKNKTVVGTPLYMSLQILKVQQYTSKCDIWALGFIFYQMLHGQTPWTAKSQYQLVKSIETKPLKIRRNDLSKDTVDFLQKCLQIHQQDRICWDQLFLHPIFNGFFDNKGKNQEFQNKLKLIMNDLRFYINSKNLDLCKILISLGYYDQNTQMNFEQYFNFLQTVNPSIKKQQALYIFKKTDIDNSNTISIYEIQKILAKHAISLTSTFKNPPKFQRKDTQTFAVMSQQTSKKITNCFTKLHKIITRNKITLKKVFHDFDKEGNGKLSEKQFKHMIRKLDKQMPDDDIIQAFNMIDQDGSKTIQYDELINYYSKVNGIPIEKIQDQFQKMDIEKMDVEQQKPYQQPNNPFMQVQHQNSYPPQNFQNYQPPPPPPQGYYNGYNQFYPQQFPQNYQQPPQQKGMFGNFIMNQIQNKMHGSSTSLGGSNKSIW